MSSFRIGACNSTPSIGALQGQQIRVIISADGIADKVSRIGEAENPGSSNILKHGFPVIVTDSDGLWTTDSSYT